MIDRIRMPQMELPGPRHSAGMSLGCANCVVIPASPSQHAARSSAIETIRIGAVSYLNSKPLIEGLSELLPDAQLVLDLPSRLADDLASGLLDVALIPSIESFADPDYEVVSDACVATRGPVLSVKLYSRVPPGEIRTLALDEGSRTSAALVQIILAERYGVRPRLEPFAIGCGVEETAADAVLMIGDRAMRPPVEDFHTVWDLGELWTEWTGLPFVFAMWVGRRDGLPEGIEQALCEARDRGTKQLTDIAAREAVGLGISEQKADDYLRHNLHFRLTSAEQSGLRLFHELAVESGFAPQAPLSLFARRSEKTTSVKFPTNLKSQLARDLCVEF